MATLLQRRRTLAVAGLIALLAVVAYQLFGSSSVDVSTTSAPEQAPAEAELASNQEADEADAVDAVDAEVLAANETRGDRALQGDAGGFSGDAEVDLPAADPDVIIIEDLIAGVAQRDLQPPIPTLPPLGDIGWDIQDLRVKYLAETDELLIGLNSYGIVGDPEGNNDPASFDQRWIDGGAPGTDTADLGANEGVTIALDLDQDGIFDAVVGTHYGNTISDIAVFEFTDFGLFAPLTPIAYGNEIGSLGTAPISPTADAPDLVFTIANFSELPGNDGSLSFGINANMGGGADGNIGEDSIGEFAVPIAVELDARIGDFVFEDSNANGIQDADEPGIADVTVRLLDEGGDVLEETATDADGEFNFTVPPGTFIVEFVAPEASSITEPEQGDDRATDSNPDPLSGRTPLITVGPGDEDLTIDAGIVPFNPAPAISIEKSTNGEDADDPTGPTLVVGSTATFTYEVTNTGNVALDNVSVTDDQIGPVTCPVSELAPGESTTCTATATVIEGQYRNVGSVTGTPTGPGTEQLTPVSDSDPSHHVGIVPFQPAPSIDLEKLTNGQDADEATGPELIVGEEATFTFIATNTGNVDLVDVVIDDNVLGPICTIERIEVGADATCETTATVTEGQQQNIGSVAATGELPNGERLTDPVIDEDPSNHIGIVPGPPCVVNIRGPRMFHGSTVEDQTGLVAAPGSSIFVVTDEPGGSPDQPNEQVYFQVGEELFGPTPVGLGEFEFTVGTGGPVVVLHHSVVTGDTSLPNSVEYEWCGTDLTEQGPPPVYTCPTSITGPRMFLNSIVEWDSGLIAAAGSTIEITTSEPGGSPGQPHEQVYLIVGDETFGPTPNDHGTTTFNITNGGAVQVVHYSVFNEGTVNPNSVEFTLCGSSLTEAE